MPALAPASMFLRKKWNIHQIHGSARQILPPPWRSAWSTRPNNVTSQSVTRPVVQLLRDGCAHVRQALDIEKIDLDSLIDTVMADKQAAAGEIAAFKGIKFADLKLAYQQFCKNEPITSSVVNVGQVIEFYNRAAANLPDPTRLRGLQLPGMTTVLDTAGAKLPGCSA
jgi:hypothetical protein